MKFLINNKYGWSKIYILPIPKLLGLKLFQFTTVYKLEKYSSFENSEERRFNKSWMISKPIIAKLGGESSWTVVQLFIDRNNNLSIYRKLSKGTTLEKTMNNFENRLKDINNLWKKEVYTI